MPDDNFWDFVNEHFSEELTGIPQWQKEMCEKVLSGQRMVIHGPRRSFPRQSLIKWAQAWAETTGQSVEVVGGALVFRDVD